MGEVPYKIDAREGIPLHAALLRHGQRSTSAPSSLVISLNFRQHRLLFFLQAAVLEPFTASTSQMPALLVPLGLFFECACFCCLVLW